MTTSEDDRYDDREDEPGDQPDSGREAAGTHGAVDREDPPGPDTTTDADGDPLDNPSGG
ncbi:hypothetical protein [Microbacterium radiodurans]|uniref:hypothetical protein n=1 Tax=Microbacterium radiodurans TaxID=661398 RepID=UPI00168A5D49|nr:hypothetical protein [Microbacterium radiodurans]